MTFRPHSVVAVMLFSTMVYAQASSPACEAAGACCGKGCQQLRAAYPVMSQAAEERGRKLFEMFEAGQAGAIWATFSAEDKKNTRERKEVRGHRRGM